MLPDPCSPDFPAALKARRESLGLSRSALARAAGIHVVMPRRYEEPDCREFAQPRTDTTWLALNRALGYDVPDEVSVSTPKTESSAVTPASGSQSLHSPRGLTIAEAKAGLAATLGVSVDCIEIIIRS